MPKDPKFVFAQTSENHVFFLAISISSSKASIFIFITTLRTRIIASHLYNDILSTPYVCVQVPIPFFSYAHVHFSHFTSLSVKVE